MDGSRASAKTMSSPAGYDGQTASIGGNHPAAAAIFEGFGAGGRHRRGDTAHRRAR